MNSIDLQIENDYYHCQIHLNHRISIFRGESAIGKTTLAELLVESPNDCYCNKNVNVVNETTWDAVIRGTKNSLIIFDDLDIIRSEKFARLVNEFCIPSDLWFLIISREVLSSSTRDISGNLSIATDAIYNFCTNGTEHWIEPYFTLDRPDFQKIDTLLMEDSGYAYKFLARELSDINVLAADSGKSSVVPKLDEIRNNSQTLLFVDMTAFAFHIDQLFDKFKNEINTTIFLLKDLISFEEVLLQSNLFKRDQKVQKILQDIPEYANSCISWETFFEKLISEVTYKKPYRVTHRTSELNECYTLSCSLCNPNLRAKCSFNKTGDKLTALFSNTKYACLLQLGRKHTLQSENTTDMSAF